MKLRLRINWPKTRLPPVNWFGLVAGALMLMLPFLGPWWRATVGTEAMKVAFSPFHYEISILGKPLSSALIGYVILAAKLTVLIGGALLIAGSALPQRWWSKRLVQFGATKVLWMLVGLILLVVGGAFFANTILPNLISGMTEGGGGVQLNLPYLSGTTTSTIQAGGAATVTAPITASITGIFWVAVGVAAFGVAARIYHQRFVKSEKPKK